MRHKEFWIALGVGAMAGGIVALLYAPQSGVATRKKIRRGVEDFGESLEETADYLREQAEKLGKEAQKLVEASIERGKDRFDDAVTTAVKSAKGITKLV